MKAQFDYSHIMKQLTAEVNSIEFLEETALASYSNTPQAFHALLPEILTILEANLPHLIKGHQHASIALGNLMTASVAPDSDGENSDFICQLEYFIRSKHPQMDPSSSNAKTQHSVIINFTTGDVMSEKRYLNLLFSDEVQIKNADRLYGKLSSTSLAKAWKEGLQKESDMLSSYNSFSSNVSISPLKKTPSLEKIVNYCYQAMGFFLSSSPVLAASTPSTNFSNQHNMYVPSV